MCRALGDAPICGGRYTCVMAAGGEQTVGGVVLAGGGGRRFGGPKAGVVLAGVTLVERAVGMLVERCADVVVVTRPGVVLPRLTARVVFDRPGLDAPLAAVATGLAALDSDVCVVLACDLPFAAPVVDRLLAAPAGAAVAVDAGGRAQPLCARYPRVETLAVCERLLAGGAAAMRDLLDVLDQTPVAADDGELLNVNTPADLVRSEALLAHERGRTSTTAL